MAEDTHNIDKSVGVINTRLYCICSAMVKAWSGGQRVNSLVRIMDQQAIDTAPEEDHQKFRETQVQGIQKENEQAAQQYCNITFSHYASFTTEYCMPIII